MLKEVLLWELFKSCVMFWPKEICYWQGATSCAGVAHSYNIFLCKNLSSEFIIRFRQLVTQYEAVSFGDSLFSCYVLLPLQQCHSVSLRVVLWDEHVPALQSIFIPVKEVCKIVYACEVAQKWLQDVNWESSYQMILQQHRSSELHENYKMIDNIQFCFLWHRIRVNFVNYPA